MKNIAVIGSGISGLAAANLLSKDYNVTVFERDTHPGGLIKCRLVDGNLFHLVGGHCFNSKRNDVLDWFWQFFDKDLEFSQIERNAVAVINGQNIGYPVENHLYQMKEDLLKQIINELLTIENEGITSPNNFKEFLRYNFGETLYELYFKPYNEKIWRQDLAKVPLSWLQGKLPMPKLNDIIINNIRGTKENVMVHSTFNYPNKNGSQFIANRLAQGLNIKYKSPVTDLRFDGSEWIINEAFKFDALIYTGNIKALTSIMQTYLSIEEMKSIENLQSHGTTTVLCEIDSNDYSWMYLPSRNYESHRIICTGNFAESNNDKGIRTGTIEFSEKLEKEGILYQLSQMPLNPKYIDHNYQKYTYPVQDESTRLLIKSLKLKLGSKNFHLLGRFAEWEYYNMDTAIGAAIDLVDGLSLK